MMNNSTSSEEEENQQLPLILQAKKEYNNWRWKCCFETSHSNLMIWVDYLKNDFLETQEQIDFYMEVRKFRNYLTKYYSENNFSNVFAVINKIEEKIIEIKTFTEKIKEYRRGSLIYILDKLERNR